MARFCLARLVMLAVLAAAGTSLVASPAEAAGAPLDAVGRISYGAVLQPGHAICSGTLVTADLVLTAGHCLRTVKNPGTVRFSAAWKNGKPTLERTGQAIFLAEPDMPQHTLAGDAALLALDHPVSPDEATPLPLADPVADRFAIMGFDRTAPNIERFDPNCNLTGAEPGVIGLSCPVVSGNSGSPVLQWDGKAWSIAAVTVAATPAGPIRAWAALVPQTLKDRIAAKP